LFIDTDPAFQQARMEAEPAWHDYVASHDVHCSFAELIGQPECSVPTRDLVWHATRQPVVLDVWPVQSAPRDGAFTTVMQWESYRRRVLHGIELHMKDASMEPMWDLPGRVGVTLEMALGGKAAPRTALAAAGWSLRDPMEVSASLWTYQQYLQSSRGEFSVAKHGYVVTRTGWFSERSANYLASGRPVVTEDTGFSKWMTTGLGILSFRTADEAAAAVCEVAGNYDAHARAARELAEEYFDATTVLTALLDLVR
jgi:hypothetical protein